MEFDRNLSKLQGTLLSLGRQRMLNCADSTDKVVDLLKGIIQNLSKSEKFKITFFMVLNTDLSASEELKNDENLGLITHITPVIEKNYLIDYLYKLNLQSHLNTIIENYPGAFTLELVDVYVGKLKEASFHKDEYGLDHIYNLWRALFAKAWRMERGDDDVGSKKFVSAFEELYALIQKVVVASMKIGGEKLECFIGGHLYHLFDTIWFCLNLHKNTKEVEAVERFEFTVTLKSDFDEIVEKPCEKCLDFIFRDIRDILEALTVEIWMSLSECYFESESKTSMQELIGGRIYDICQILEGSEAPRDVLNCLSVLKIKPKTESDEIAAASLKEIISNVKNKKEVWFKALVRHAGFTESKALRTVLRNLTLADDVDVGIILNTTLAHIIDSWSQSQVKGSTNSTLDFEQDKKTEDVICAGDMGRVVDSSDSEKSEISETSEAGAPKDVEFQKLKDNLKLSKQVFLQALKMTREHSPWMEKVFQSYRPYLLDTDNSDFELEVTFNKLWKEKEESVAISDWVCLCMQLPREILERLCSFAMYSEEIERCVGVLKILEPACQVMGLDGKESLLEEVLLFQAINGLTEKERRNLASLVVGVGKEGLITERFFQCLLRLIENELNFERTQEAVQCLEILKSWLEADLFKGDRLSLLVYLSRVLGHLTWNLDTFSTVISDGRDLVDVSVGFLMKNIENEDESRLNWARMKIGLCLEINQAYFCDLWFRFGKPWLSPCRTTLPSSLLALAHSTLNTMDTEFKPEPHNRTYVLLGLRNILPVLNFHKWLSIFDRILKAYPKDCYYEVLEIFAQSQYLLTLSLNDCENIYPCYEHCLRNLGRLIQTCLPKMTPESSAQTFKKILFVLHMIRNKEQQRDCSLVLLPVLLELIDKVKDGGGTEEREIKIRMVLEVFCVKEVVEATKRKLNLEVHEFEAKMDFVKVIFLGGAGVGKTSIVQRFVHNEFSEKYTPTDQKETYFPSVIINDHLYELKISDIPVISYFPVNSYYEWADFRFYGLRSATAYVLVFDLSNVETFQFVRTMREQMMESRDMKHVPLLIVGNKQDLIAADAAGPNAGLVPPSTNNSVSNNLDANQRKRRDIVNLVKKHWKCNYVECSAKYNWGVIAVFKELMEVIDSMDPNKNHSKEVYSSPMIDNIQDALDGNKCVIL